MPVINKHLEAGQILYDSFQKEEAVLNIYVPQNAMYEASFLLEGQRVDVNVYLQGKGASCNLKATYLSSTKQDNNLVWHVYHECGLTQSRQQVKGVLVGKGRANYQGAVHIPSGCRKCDGDQNHRAILLSDDAGVSCTPELEIYADDVKCSHGSAMGSVDENQLFYLLARGICQKEATRIIVQGFLSEDMPKNFVRAINEWMVAYV